MPGVKNNPLLAITLLGLLGYWSIAWFIPGFILSSAMSVFSILIGAAILVRYSAGAVQVLFFGARSENGDGAHLAALGIPSIAASIVWGGLFVLAWNIAGQPESWLATPVSNFSRVMLIAGCVALYLTPDVDRRHLSLPGVVWLVALLITAAVVAFLLGLSAQSEFTRRIMGPSDFATCPKDRPIWGASGSKIYHAPDSPWRALVNPRRCFRNSEEAQAAGFRESKR